MFDQRFYNDNDLPAKTTVSGWLTGSGHTVVESGKYAIDLSVTHADARRYGVECGRRHVPHWGPNSNFPYPTLNVPKRRAKFSNPQSFATVNATCDSMVLIPGETVTGAPPVRQWTANRRWEEFYCDVAAMVSSWFDRTRRHRSRHSSQRYYFPPCGASQRFLQSPTGRWPAISS